MIIRPSLASFALATLPALALSAQSTWFPAAGGAGLDLHVGKGFYENPGIRFATVSPVVTLRFAVSQKAVIETELPFAFASVEGDTHMENTSRMWGNPYLGVAVNGAPAARVRLGFRLGMGRGPFYYPEVIAIGSAMNQEFERAEAYLADVHALRGLVELGALPERGTFAQARIGATLLMAPGDEAADSEALLDYGLRLGWRTAAVIAHIGLTGRANLTRDDGSFADRTQHLLTLGLEATRGTVRPIVEVRYFLDEGAREQVKGMVNLGLMLPW